MFSILKHSTYLSLAAALLVAGASGCAYRHATVAYDNIFPEPGEDAATTRRSFPPTDVVYENTAVIAWSTHSPFVVRPNAKDSERIITEPLIFFGNIFAAPVTFVMAPPLTSRDQKAWRVSAVPPTHTAAPTFESVVPPERGPIIPAIRPDIFDGPSSGPRELPTGGYEAKGREVRKVRPKAPAAAPSASEEVTTPEAIPAEPAVPAPTTQPS